MVVNTYPGRYSPTSDRPAPPPERGMMRAFAAASLKDCAALGPEIRRYFQKSFDREFLASVASRRDLWRILLPLPGIFAFVADRGDNELMIMNAALSVTVFLMSSLPQAWLLSDIVFCLLYASYIPLHSVLGFVPPSVTAPSGPALATLTMAAAGVNVWILLGFVVISYGTAPYVAYAWTTDQLLVCLYVLFLMLLIEHRATLLQGRSGLQQSGYKALISAEDAASAQASRGPVDPLSSRFTADTLSRTGGTNSDAEDNATPPPVEGQDFAFLNGLWARIREQKSSGPMSSIFARLTTGQRSVASTSAAPRHRFAADKVQQPGAAVHEAPYFSEREMEFLMQDVETGLDSQRSERQPMLIKTTTDESMGSLPFPGSPMQGGSPLPSPTDRFMNSPGGSLSGSTRQQFQAVKLGGFQNPQLNALFVERNSPEFRVNGRETYWPASGQYFIYRSAGTNTWGIAKARRFQAVKDAKSNGVAHSPSGFELWLEADERQPSQRKGWREWDIQQSKWVQRPEAGVVSRGKVRPKAGVTLPKAEAEVQTCVEERMQALQVKEAATQTLARVHQKPIDTNGHDASIALSSMALGSSSQTSPQGKSHHKAGADKPYRGGSTDTLLGVAAESQGSRRPSVRLDSPSPSASPSPPSGSGSDRAKGSRPNSLSPSPRRGPLIG